MSRLYCIIACIALVALLVAPATAETTRSFGMGDTRIAIDNTAGAWSSNPALLPLVNHGSPSTSDWSGSAAFTAAIGSGAVSNIQITEISLHDAGRNRGFGAGYVNIMGIIDIYGAAYGQRLGSLDGLTVGLTVANVSMGPIGNTIFNIGLAQQLDLPTTDVIFGLLIRDVTDEAETQVDLGVAATLPSGFTAAVDLIDVGGTDVFNVGAEYASGPYSLWLGAADSDLTAGARYAFGVFAVSLAYQDWGVDDAWFGGGEIGF